MTAAVVGAIFYLAFWFCLNTLFGQFDEIRTYGLRLLVPAWPTLDLPALHIVLVGFLVLLRIRAGMLFTLAGSALAGMVFRLLVPPLSSIPLVLCRKSTKENLSSALTGHDFQIW